MSSDLGFDIDPSVLQGFLEESKEALASLDSLFVSLEQDPYNTSIISAIFRPVHSMKGNAPFFGLMRLKTIAHEFESLLAALRDKKIQSDKALINLLLAGVDEIKAIVDRVGNKQPEVADEARFKDLIDRAKAAATGAPPPAANEAPVAAPAPATKDSSGHSAEATKSMRVSEERIDTFLGFVGELVIAQDMLRHFSSKIHQQVTDNHLTRELDVINGLIANLGFGLEKAIMSIRKVSIKTLLQKVPRLIRDVAAAKGKEIAVKITGDDIEIDKSLVELLDAPITHMARNAADHGVELPALREKAGKAKQGTVTIDCLEDATHIILTIRDDGAGLNYEGLRKKAEALGILKPGEPLTDAEAVNLIFMAGVSTAQELSDISGRGVGMDVVKRNVEAAGGAITVKSTAGQGSEFTIKLPRSVTTQIMQGFVVQVDNVNLVLPLHHVQESWSLDKEDITDVVNEGPQVQRHDKILPLVDLPALLNIPSTTVENPSQLVVTIDSNTHLLALRVDEIAGPRQVVLKTLDSSVNQNDLFLGGALLGDGAVALILDVTKLQPALHEAPV